MGRVQSVSWTKQWLRRREICLGRPAPGCCTEEYPSSTEQLLRVYLSAFHLEGLDCQLKVQGTKSYMEELPAAALSLLAAPAAACLPSGCRPDTLCGSCSCCLLETLPMQRQLQFPRDSPTAATLFRHSQPFVPAIRQFGLFDLSAAEKEGVCTVC